MAYKVSWLFAPYFPSLLANNRLTTLAMPASCRMSSRPRHPASTSRRTGQTPPQTSAPTPTTPATVDVFLYNTVREALERERENVAYVQRQNEGLLKRLRASQLRVHLLEHNRETMSLSLGVHGHKIKTKGKSLRSSQLIIQLTTLSYRNYQLDWNRRR